MITKLLSQKVVLLVIGLAAGSGILIPASYGSFHPVTSSEIQDGTIQSIDIGDGQVKTVDIGASAVTNAKLANGAVNSAKIGDNSIAAADIATNAVGASEIANDAVGAAEMQGVTKLMFQKYVLSEFQATTPRASPSFTTLEISLPGAEAGDTVIVSLDGVSNQNCIVPVTSVVTHDHLSVTLANVCSGNAAIGAGAYLSILLYDNFIT